jgi:phage baseplate assembly protein W
MVPSTPRFDGGKNAGAVNEGDVRQAILVILGTRPGERVVPPDFGAGLGA